jgi:hypothetical protein
LRAVSEALVIPAEGGRGAVPRGRCGEGAAAPGAGATVPLSAEVFHPAGQVLHLLREVGVGWCASAREFRSGDGLGYAVGTACCGVQVDFRLGGEGDLNVPW